MLAVSPTSAQYSAEPPSGRTSVPDSTQYQREIQYGNRVQVPAVRCSTTRHVSTVHGAVACIA
eukprot:3602145-Rhodomonas_salina.1